MRPVDFTSEQIIEAGQSLQGTGRSITGFALRQKIGGGNPKRLKQVWDDHLASQAVVQAEPVAELPVEVSDQLSKVSEALVAQINAMAIDINDRAVKASEHRVRDVVRAAGEQCEQAERELVDASQTVEDLEQQNDDLGQQLAQAHAVKQALAVELAQLKERIAGVERAALVAAEDATTREQALRVELDKQCKAEQAAREKEAWAVGAQAAMEKQHQEDSRVYQEVARELRTLSDALSETRALVAHRDGQIEQAQDALTQARGELQVVKSELKEVTQTALEASAREKAALAQLEELKRSATRVAKGAKSAVKTRVGTTERGRP